MKLSWDEAKRQATIEERGLDFASAGELFSGLSYTAEDARKDYGEQRYISAGLISGRLCVIVWTPRGSKRHVISMRKANDREQKRFKASFEQG
jgi:hypothetical protein